MPAQVDVVILEDDEAAHERLGLRQLVNPLQHGLAQIVGGMGLAGEDELHGPLGVVEDFADQRHVAHDQVGPLVRGKPPGEADGERLGIEGLAQLVDDGGRTGRAARPGVANRVRA